MIKIQITTVAELGEVIRATRKANNIRLDDVASMAGLSPVFVGDVEYGKSTVQMGRVLQLLRELGLKLVVDVPVSTMPELQKIHERGGLVRPGMRKNQPDLEK
ncbi:helix-turn-helix domain-containing protein [Undibacterium pigrum]|uniref:Helix-turn-helix protein n=1 Tax=Undibacterium pigrum TaxID=401470 RepID=A0A318J7X4_9BURK|nr:helix-turn-helix domain-containing protein [Undibacterium pigrum]PXX36842.1 helix-turn-helix protein [Undibacterium pigrum]